MSDQEDSEIHIPNLQDSDDSPSDAMGRLSALRLTSFPSSFSSSSSSSATATAVLPTASSGHLCTFCGSASTVSGKRRSPSSSLASPNPSSAASAPNPDSEPRPKKIFLEAPPSAAHNGRDLRGFTKIPLPISAGPAPSPQSSGPVLRRCCSDPVSSPGSQVTSSPESFRSALSDLQSPETAVCAANSTPSPAKPPLHPTLRRCVSDPTASSSPKPPSRREREAQMAWAGPSTLSSSGEMNLGYSPTMTEYGRDESPNFKRLRRMKERMKEMSQWWDQVMREGEEEQAEEEEDGGSETRYYSSSSKIGSETETEEAVSVESVGACLCIHFKCPCGKGYQILLSGKNCYYKLT